jgi:DnaJ homolog subfamily C member 19
MLKVIIAVVVLSIVCRWALGKWPWEYLQTAPTRHRAVLHARQLLGVETGAGREEIIAAHRRLTSLVHPDRGGSHIEMQEANAARDLLLDELPSRRDGISH